MNEEVVYIAELDADVDDVVAAHYLHKTGFLKCVVCDPYPKTSIGLNRKNQLEQLGINVLKKMPPIAKYIFVGGALTLVADYIRMHHVDYLVMNGGYVGSNIVPESNQLDKFKGKETVRTFNFNCDVKSTDYVLRSTEKQISNIILVGKNVCHSRRNSEIDLWKDKKFLDLFRLYQVKPGKCQHDMLACHEGISIITGAETFCEYEKVKPYNEGLNGSYTKWGSTKHKDTPYREVMAAVRLK